MKKSTIYFSLLSVFLIFLFTQCDENKPKDNSANHTVVLKKAPVFNADSAYVYTARQVAFGPRVPNTKAHVQCGNYLVNYFKGLGLKVIEQTFSAPTPDKKYVQGRNIIVSIAPEKTKRILLAAHWDSRPWADQDSSEKYKSKPIDGANDGASGVAVLMELARVMAAAKEQPSVGVDIILFDVEDYGKSEVQDSYCLGSQFWSKNKHVPNYTAYFGILLDMVGGKNAVFTKESISMQYAPSIVQHVWETAYNLGYGNYFSLTPGGMITDDHYYVNTGANIPMIDIIEYHPSSGFGDFWHTHNDDMSVIDKNTLKAVGQTVTQVVYNQ